MSKYYYEVSGTVVAEFSEIVRATSHKTAEKEAAKLFKVLGHKVIDLKIDNIDDLNKNDFED